MRTNPIKDAAEASNEDNAKAIASLSKIAFELLERDLRARIATLEAQAQRYQSAIDNVSQGVCLFDGDERLVLCNRRYAEIYRLAPEQVRPGARLSEIVEHRFAAGTYAMAPDDYLALAHQVNSGAVAKTWIVDLNDGRRIQICCQPMHDGEWIATHEDVTELKVARNAMDERISLQTLIDWVPDYLWVKDAESRFVVANQALASDSGRAEASEMVGLSDLDLHAPEAARAFRAIEQDILSSGQPMIDREELVVDASGARKWFSSTKVPVRDDRNGIFGLVGIARNITERKREDALRDGQSQILRMIALSAPLEEVLERLMHLVESQLTGIHASVLLLDEDGGHLRSGAAPSLSPAYTKAIDGLPIGPSAGSCGAAAFRREAVIVKDITQDPLWEDWRELAATHGYRSCWSTPIFSHQGAVLGTFAMYSATVREPSQAETRHIEEATNIAGIAIERKQSEDRIHFLANHDALTGLPNRALLESRLSQAISSAERSDCWAAVVFVDLDNFKIVNDSLGHNAGDELLKIVSRRMADGVRTTDTVIRLGGDEFIIVLLDQPKRADIVAAKIQTLTTDIAAPVRLLGHDLKVTSSMGIALYPGDGADADALIANADAAMYRAKALGRDNFQFYTPALNAGMQKTSLLQERLQNAAGRAERDKSPTKPD